MSEQVRRVLHDEQPESKPVGVTLVASLESPENHRQGIGGDADAAVMHGDPHFRSKTARADRHGAAGRRVINGIPYQISQDAAEQNRVAKSHAARRGHPQHDSFQACRFGELGDNLVEDGT